MESLNNWNACSLIQFAWVFECVKHFGRMHGRNTYVLACIYAKTWIILYMYNYNKVPVIGAMSCHVILYCFVQSARSSTTPKQIRNVASITTGVLIYIFLFLLISDYCNRLLFIKQMIILLVYEQVIHSVTPTYWFCFWIVLTTSYQFYACESAT